jgi:hypothetical protein
VMRLIPHRLPRTHETVADRAHSPTPCGSPETCDRAARSRPRRRTLELLRRQAGTALVVVAVITLAMAGMTGRAAAAQVLAAPAASVDQVLANLRAWLVGILAGLATVFLTLGGIRYVMAGGNPGEIEKAKSAFRGAGIGYGLAVLAPLVVSVLRGIVGG